MKLGSGIAMRRVLKAAGFLLIPLAALAMEVAFRFPAWIESAYAGGLYPGVVKFFGVVNRARFSWAEVMVVAGSAVALLALFRAVRAPRAKRLRAVAGTLWCAGGLAAWAFLLLWGFNYARPSLETRMGLSIEEASPEDLVEAGKRTASRTSSLFEGLEASGAPTRLPMSFAELDAIVDSAYRELRLPGDDIRFATTPAKPLWGSTMLSYLGISGIFVPFTGEPSVNDLQPGVALPLVVAHEKAHQRGITHEGEASFAAFLACSREESPPYLRYAAYLFATQHLLGEASRYLPREDLAAAWALLGEGPLADVRALREFWRRYEGPASEVASHVNDSYLRTLRVPGGVSSYDTVARLLLALDRKGALVSPAL
jgi:hypothetical protein